jgi:ABC-type multidrug transport system ATPase subunit
MNPAIRVDNLVKQFDKTTAVDRVSFEVPEGKFT